MVLVNNLFTDKASDLESCVRPTLW